MQEFTDNTGHVWRFEVDFPSLRRVQQLTGLDLAAMASAELFRRLSSPLTFVDVLYSICMPEADGMGLSDVQFGRRCVMDLAPAVDAVLGGTADFFQRLARTQKAKEIRKIWTLSQKAAVLTEEQLGCVFERMESSLSQQIESKQSGEQSTETRETQESQTCTAVG